MKNSIIILCFVFLGCCHYGEYSIAVYNNSEKALYCRTFINSNEETSFNSYLKKNHVTYVRFGKEESEMIEKNHSQKIISVIYFDSVEEVNPSFDFEGMKLKNYVVKKYSKEDLDKLNWQINYK
jgi:hypothetical protein